MIPDYDESNITTAALSSVANARLARARQVSEALIRNLHAFIREIEPTEAEWMAGIDFLTRTGQMCSEARQEFILLSDTLGASMLVDAINHRLPTGATATTVFGPFYTPPPTFCDGDNISGGLQGAPLFITGSVASVSGEPLADAVVDIWHCAPDGLYDLQRPTGIEDLSARGRFRTSKDGSFHLWTVRPTAYPIPTDGPVGEMLEAQSRHPFRPEHVHFLVEAQGHRKLVTHLFAQDDEWLFSDVVFGVKDSLIRSFERHEGGISPDNREMKGTWFLLQSDFRLAKTDR